MVVFLLGYGPQCGRRDNADDDDGSRCKTQLRMGAKKHSVNFTAEERRARIEALLLDCCDVYGSRPPRIGLLRIQPRELPLGDEDELEDRREDLAVQL